MDTGKRTQEFTICGEFPVEEAMDLSKDTAE
jgi:hypothetical protein